VLHNIEWAGYKAIADVLGESHVRLTYSEGNLELMTLSFGHERYSILLGRFIGVLTELLDMPCASGGMTTLRREDLQRAIEPDQCYYLKNEPAVRNKLKIDLQVDPPPDLAIEVDISRSSLGRMNMYSSLGIPEVWRFDGSKLHVHRLGNDGLYQESDHSLHFPFLPIVETNAFLLQLGPMGETSLVKAFRQWVNELLAKQGRPSQNS
jgi:Uma2 family endonuclease